MPIGKNSLKRVTNNGYSAVRTTAPDMENSVIAEAEEKAPKAAPVSTKSTKSEPKTDKKTTTAAKKKPAAAPSTAKPAAKKPSTKTASTKTASTKATATKKPAASIEEKPDAVASASVIPAPSEVVMAVVASGTAENDKSYCNLGDAMPIHLL